MGVKSFIFFVLMILLVEYYIDTKSRKEQNAFLKLWANYHLPDQTEEDKINTTSQPIKNEIDVIKGIIESKIKDDNIEQYITKPKNVEHTITAHLLNGKNDSKSIPWQISSNSRINVDYNYGFLLLSPSLLNQKCPTTSDVLSCLNQAAEKTNVFVNFLDFLFTQGLSSSIIQLPKPTDNAKDNFNKYSEALLKYFIKDDKEYLKYSQYLRVNFIYLANNKGIYVQYPAEQEPFSSSAPSVKEFNFQERPWWKAAFKEKTSYGITDPYVDSNETGVKLVRTFWYKFTYENRDYVLCLDLLPNWDNEKSFKTQIFGFIIPFTQNIVFDSILGSFVITLIIVILDSLNIVVFRKLMNKVTSVFYKRLPNHIDFVPVKLRLRDKFYPTQQENRKTLTIEARSNHSRTVKLEKALEVNLNINSLKVHAAREGTTQQEFAYNYSLSTEYNLSINTDKLLLKGIEVWDVVLDSQIDPNDYLGHFQVCWNTDKADKSQKNELTIEELYWPAQEYEDIIEAVKEKLSEYLLKNGKRKNFMHENREEFSMIIDRKYRPSEESIPNCLEEVDLIKKTKKNISDFNKSKLEFSNIETANSNLKCISV